MTPDQPTPTDAAQWREDAKELRDFAQDLYHSGYDYTTPDLEAIATRLDTLPAAIEEQVRAAFVEGRLGGRRVDYHPDIAEELWKSSAAYARLHPGGEGDQG